MEQRDKLFSLKIYPWQNGEKSGKSWIFLKFAVSLKCYKPMDGISEGKENVVLLRFVRRLFLLIEHTKQISHKLCSYD